MNDIRCLTNDDLLQYKRLSSICYTYCDTDEPKQCTEEELRRRVGVFDEHGTLLSAMIHNSYMARFEGHDVKLLGIGGVVTDPVARGQRSIRRLFETYLPKLREEGYVFSALYPFSHAFYRKFGYELAFEQRVAEISPGNLRDDLCRADEIVRVLPDQDDQGMRQIYERYIADKHFAIERDDSMWRELRQGTPWEKMKYAYVLKRKGESIAYWIGSVFKGDAGAVLTPDDLAYTCREGREAIFAMLRGMNEVRTIRLFVPSELEPRWLVSDPYDVSFKSINCGGMLRVMDVEKALTLLAPPPIAGSVTIQVADELIAENNGCFTVMGDGSALRIIREEKRPADLRCTVNGLSVLFGGLQDFNDALLAGHATLMTEECRWFASMLFPKRKSHLNWGF
ncbi:MAG: GNAT family N-acetyltransferase [Christensenellaceae bacterium]|nr:GNAT family N-acetyltransferase [Christensenellaceae bacterium]